MAKTTANREQTGGDDHVSIGQASKFLGVSVDTIRRWERAGKLKAYRLDGKNRYFRQKDLDFFRQLQPLSTSDVAKALGVSASTVRRLEAQGKLKSVRDHNGKRLYQPMSLSEYVTAAEPEELPTTSDLASQKTEIAPAQTAHAAINNRGDDSFRIGRWQRGLLRLATAVLLVLLGVSLWQPHTKLNDVATTQPIKTPVAKLTIKDVNKSASLVLPSTFFVELPKAGLTVNITNQSVTGVAKASIGPFATRPITNDELANGSVKLSNLAPDLQALISALPSSGTRAVTTVNQTTNQTTVVAGVGLSGSSTNNVLTLGINTGQTVAVVNNNLEVQLSSGVVTSTQTSGSGLEATSSGLQLIGGCAAGQILAWNGTAWTCANGGGGGGGSVAVQENGTTVTPTATAINFNGSDFTVVNNAGTATVAIDYANSGIAQVSATEAVTGNWSFKDSGFTLASAGDTTKKAQFDLSGVASGTTRTFSVPNTSGTLITSGNLTSITGTGALASGSIGSGFGAISTGNTISTTAGLQGGSLSVGSGAFAVNASGAITAATGIVSSGTVQFTGLGSAGIVYADGTGKLSTSSVVLGTDTIGAYVQSIGATTGITVGGTASVPTLSVSFGASAGMAAQGNTALTFTGSGNLTGSLSGTAGGGFTTTTLAVSATPTFTSVTAPTFTNAGNLALSATGAGHNLTLSATGSIIISNLDCSTNGNGGKLTVNSSHVLGCADDIGGGTGAISGSGTANQIAMFNGPNSITGSSLVQNGTTLQVSSGTDLELIAGNLTLDSGTVSATSFTGALTGNVLGDVTGDVTGSLTGNADTATTLAVNPTDCSLNTFATTIDASGNLTCAHINVGSADITGNLLASSLQSAAADLGAANVTVNLSNSHAGFVTNFVTNGTINGATIASGSFNGVSIGGGSVAADLTGNVTGSVTGNASTATALATNPTDCSADDFAQSIDAQGNLTCAAIVLGTNTSGSYVQALGSVTGLSVGGTASVPTLSVLYGNGANQAAAGSTDLSFTGSGNLTGSITATAGGGVSANTLAVVSSPTFSGTVSASALTVGGNAVITSGGVLQNVTASTAILTSGTLGVARGGTGAGTLTAGGILLGNGTGAVTALADTAAGACLLSNGSGSAPQWGSCASGGGITGSGTSSQVAYFSSGNTLGGDAGFTYDGGTQTLSATNIQGTLTGNVTGSLTGNASTATALAANPSDCGSNTFATTIDASGNLTCANVNLGTAAVTGNLLASSLQNSVSDLGNADITVNLSNSHVGHVTNFITNGTVNGATIASTGINGANITSSAFNGLTVSSGALSGVTGITFSSTGNLDLDNSSIINGGSITASSFSGSLSGNVIGNLTGNVTGTLSGNASTANALASNPSDCGTNNFATAIDASGNLTCLAITANSLPNAPTDLGAINQTVDFSNSHAGYNTNLVVDGTINGATVASGSFNGVTIGSDAVNGLTISAGALSGVTGITFTSGNLALGGGNITGAGTISATSFTGALTGNVLGDVTGNVTGSLTGNADTATALAVNPTDCSLNTFATTIDAQGNLSCAAVALGSGTTGNYLSGIAGVTGLTIGGTNGSSTGGSVTLSVNYGNGANQAAAGSNTITCPTVSGGNLGGGGGSFKVGDGGSCSGITFSTTPSFTSATIPSITSGVSTDLGLTAGSGTVNLSATKVATTAGLTFDLTSASYDTYTITNSGAGKASLSVEGSVTAGTGVAVTSGGVTITAGGETITAGGLNVNGTGITNAGSIAGVTGVTFSSAGTLDLDGGNVSNGGTITATTFSGNLTGNVTGNVTGALTGNATTATSLQSTPTNCPANTFAQSIDTQANLTCAHVSVGSADITGTLGTNHGGTGLTSFTANGVFYASSTSAVGQLTGSDAQVLLSNAGTPVFTTLSGDVTISGTGVTTIGASKVDSSNIVNSTIVNADLASGSFTNITAVGTLGSLTVSGSANLGSTSVSSLRVGTSATAGYVLTADASGNATWQAPNVQAYYGASGSGGTLISNGNLIYTTSVATNSSGVATVTLPAGIFSTIHSIQVTAVGGTTAPNAVQAGVQSVNGTTSFVVQSWNESATLAGGSGGLGASYNTLQQPKYVAATVYVTVIGE